jgi:uncharacterized membrane protein YoaK (UPF0700 family)
VAAIPGRDAAGPQREAGPATRGRAVTHGAEPDGARSVLFVLLTLTFLSGVVDAVCYLGLGRVFTANMTGNIVILGFAAAGAPGFSVSASLTSLAVFLVGAVAGGRLAARVASRKRALSAAITAEAIFVGAGAAVACTVATVVTGWGRYTTIALLAFAMGIRNAVIRRLSIPDMTTTVLTMTLTGLASDSSLAGGTNPRAPRRAASVVAMLLGAIAGAALFLHKGPGLPLVLAAAAAAITALAAEVSSSIRGYLDKK